VAFSDSVDKIVTTYFAGFTLYPFVYKRKEYLPKPLRVSPSLARGLECPPMCAGCCPRFSLDYLPFEDAPYELQERQVVVNGKEFTVLSDIQEPGWHCKNVIKETGRCGIHGKQPFSCDFEIIRMKHFNQLSTPNQILTAPFGRAWQLLRVDDGRGALCGVTPISKENAIEAARKLKRCHEWMQYFELPSKLQSIVNWLENEEYLNNEPLII
jgi:Fe-S-cluster containining protein